jgi:hypothetical protein
LKGSPLQLQAAAIGLDHLLLKLGNRPQGSRGQTGGFLEHSKEQTR